MQNKSVLPGDDRVASDFLFEGASLAALASEGVNL